MDILYVAILIALFALISALALSGARLQQRKAGLRARSTGAAATPAAVPPLV